MSSPHPLVRLWRHAAGHRRRIVLASAASVANKVFDLAPPFLIGAAVDIVVRREGSFLADVAGVTDLHAQLYVLAGLTALVWVLESVFEYVFQVLWRNLAQEVQHELRVETYAHVQDLEVAYFEDRSTGGLMSVLNDDVNQLERFLDVGANEILQVLTTVLVVGASFFLFIGDLAWLAFLPVPLILWGSFKFQRTLEPRYDAVREQVGVLNGSLANNLSGVVTIKAFTAEAREVERIGAESAAYREANRGAIRLSSAFVPLIRMAILAGFTAILILGGMRALEGTLEVGVYSVMVFITQRLLWPLTRLGQTFDLYQRAMASTRRVLDLLAVPAGIEEGTRELPEPVRGEVVFDDVSFSYASGPPVLRGLDLEIPAGHTVAVVGATGAGKSTLVKLLLRLYDVTGGSVRIDGVDVREQTFASIRRPIGLVSQDVFLFHGTVRENIAYGRPDATLPQILEAARVAEAHEFIEKLPRGYDTVVGERGQKLSGGQRQRVSIARAVLSDPPILVLDEATSAVDNETEAAIQRSLDRVARGRTTIVIAHRLSTVRNADRIYVLEGGRVVEAGRHEDLVRRAGVYDALWRVQTGERAASPAPVDGPRLTEWGGTGHRRAVVLLRFLLALGLVAGAGCSAVVSPDESRLGGGGGRDGGPGGADGGSLDAGRTDGGGGGTDAGVDAGGGRSCTPGTMDRVPCGDRCGTAARVCTAEGRWEVGDCESEGACVPGETVRLSCGGGSVTGTCSDSCEAPELSCPLDVILVLDVTGSHNNVLSENGGLLVERVVQPLLSAGDVRVGVTVFADFPYSPFGRSSDRPFVGVRAPTASLTAIEGALASLPRMNGGDYPESGMEALFVLAGGDAHRTSTPLTCPAGTVPGGCWREAAARAVVVITDVAQHNAPSPTVGGALVAPYPPDLGAPSWSEVQPRMHEEGIALFALVQDRGTTENDGSRQLQSLVRMLDDDPTETVVTYGTSGGTPMLGTQLTELGDLLLARYFGG